MKYKQQRLVIILLILSNSMLFAQEQCKVLLPSLTGSYTGSCKKGFAHGKGKAVGIDTYEGSFNKGLPDGEGTYTWANGSTYIGEWIAGKRHGKGVYTLHSDSVKQVQSGLWQNDEFHGAMPPPPEITYSSGIDRYNLRKQKTALNRVMVDFYQNGGRNKGISNLSLISSSGTEVNISQSIGFENVEFPVTVEIRYNSLNKLKQAPYTVYFNFVIYEPGDWVLELHN